MRAPLPSLLRHLRGFTFLPPLSTTKPAPPGCTVLPPHPHPSPLPHPPSTTHNLPPWAPPRLLLSTPSSSTTTAPKPYSQPHHDTTATSSYTTLLQSHYSSRRFPELLNLYHEMKDRHLPIPPHAYTLVISALCLDSKPFEALAVLDDMKNKKAITPSKPNPTTYTILIHAFAKCGNDDHAMRLFRTMIDDGIPPDEVTYGVVVNCLCKAGKLEDALRWLERCKKDGIAANAKLYCILVDGFGKAGRAEEAERLFREMVEEERLVPDTHCYNAYVDALCKAGRIEDAAAVALAEMEREGCDRDVYTYTILIDGMFRKRRNEEALRLWYRMIDEGIVPTAASFRVVSSGLCLSGKWDRACRILDDMAPMGVVPENAYRDMINALCRAGRVSHACKLADDIVDKEREVPGKVRTMFINALRKAGNADLAIKMLHSKIGIGYDRIGSIKRRVRFQSLLSC